MVSDELRLTDESAPHPGDAVVEYLDFMGWSQRELARRTGITPKTVSEICNGLTSISPATSIALERALGRPAHFWLNLQRLYEEALARRADRALHASWKEWAKQFPLAELRRRELLARDRSDVEALLGFFGVSSPDSWSAVWKAAAVSYRQTRRFQSKEASVASWVREAELTAREIELQEFDEMQLRLAIPKMKGLTRERVDEAFETLQGLCASLGVAAVLVEEMPKTGISGCVKWFAERKVMLALTLRYKTDDQLWFSFFHEIGHIVLHRAKKSFLIDNAADDLSDRIVDPDMQQIEEEANRFAGDTLLEPQTLSEFVNKGEFTNESIHEFAEEQGVGPGIVVGRLQHDRVLGPHQGNSLKQRLGSRPSTER